MHLNLEPAHLRPCGRGLSRLLLKDWLHLGKLNGDITDHENERHAVAGSLLVVTMCGWFVASTRPLT